jgi:hypothetical protein
VEVQPMSVPAGSRGAGRLQQQDPDFISPSMIDAAIEEEERAGLATQPVGVQRAYRPTPAHLAQELRLSMKRAWGDLVLQARPALRACVRACVRALPAVSRVVLAVFAHAQA